MITTKHKMYKNQLDTIATLLVIGIYRHCKEINSKGVHYKQLNKASKKISNQVIKSILFDLQEEGYVKRLAGNRYIINKEHEKYISDLNTIFWLSQMNRGKC